MANTDAPGGPQPAGALPLPRVDAPEAVAGTGGASTPHIPHIPKPADTPRGNQTHPYGKSSVRLHELRRQARAARQAYLAGLPDGDSASASTSPPAPGVGPTAPAHPDPVRQAATAARRHYKAKTRTTRKVIERLMRKGETPVEFLTRTFRDEGLSVATRMEAAIAAAPYFHPKLASTTLDLAGGVSVRAVKYAPEGEAGGGAAAAPQLERTGADAPEALPPPDDDAASDDTDNL